MRKETPCMIDIKDINNTPSLEDISEYIGAPIFHTFYEYLTTTYNPICKIEYSKDSLLKGWNIKFRKSGRALCTLYPKSKYITVLVVVGKKEKASAEALLPSLSKSLQYLYHNTNEGMNQKWLMIDIDSYDAMYQDMLKLIALRLNK